MVVWDHDDEQEDAPFLEVEETALGTRLPAFQSPTAIVFLISLFQFFLTMTGHMLHLPVLRLLEDVFCHIHYEDRSLAIIDEMRCKVDGVQSQLAYLTSRIHLCTSIASFAAALAFSSLADKWGRKPAAFLSCCSLLLYTIFYPLVFKLAQSQIRSNPNILIISSLFTFVGGGYHVLIASLYAIAADVSSEEKKASNFVHLTLGSSAGGVLGSIIGGVLLKRFGPWVPLYIVLGLMPFIMSMILFIPETLGRKHRAEKEAKSETGSFVRTLDGLGEALTMLRNPNIVLVMVYYLFFNARETAYGSILAQHLSKHFGWHLAETSFLTSPLGALHLVVLVLTPHASGLLTSKGLNLSSFHRDLLLTRASAMVFVVGAVLEAATTNIVPFIGGLVIQSLGAANSPLARATMTHHVASGLTSRLYVLISIAEIAGAAVGAPVLAWFFSVGLAKKGVWTGLPWFYCAFFGTLIMTALAFVRPPPTKCVEEDTDEEGSIEMDVRV